jgi:hypothetical protein
MGRADVIRSELGPLLPTTNHLSEHLQWRLGPNLAPGRFWRRSSPSKMMGTSALGHQVLGEAGGASFTGTSCRSNISLRVRSLVPNRAPALQDGRHRVWRRQAVMVLAIEASPRHNSCLLDQARLLAASEGHAPRFEPQVQSQVLWRTRIPTSGHRLCGCACQLIHPPFVVLWCKACFLLSFRASA